MDFKNVLLLIFLCKKSFVKSLNSIQNREITLDEEFGSKYSFDMFENFEGTKNVYLQEANVVQKLMNLKTMILETKNKIKTFMEISKQDNIADILMDFRKVINLVLKNQRENSIKMIKITNQYPSKQDMIGAIKGIKAI